MASLVDTSIPRPGRNDDPAGNYDTSRWWPESAGDDRSAMSRVTYPPMARLLTLQLLCQFDCAVGHFTSLERNFEKSKKSYCETLEASSQGWHKATYDSAPWPNYFGVCCCGRTGNSNTGSGPSSEAVAPKATACGP